MEFVPAATLWVLTIVRLPTARDARRRCVFLATFFAAVACTLYVPAVYHAVDPLLGGKNRVGLATLLSLVIGFWQFRSAILLAVLTEDERRRRQLIVGRLVTFAACAAVVVGFSASRVDATDQNLPLTYGDQPGMAVFLWTGSAFIIWVCGDIARVCRINIPGMRTRAFRSAFILIGIGCVMFALVLVNRLIYGAVVSVDGAAGPAAIALNVLYGVGETLAVLLVSVGLLLPRLASQLHHTSFDLNVRVLLLKIDPIWERITAGQRQLVLAKPHPKLALLQRHPENQLHRRLVEIRDCEMSSPVTAARLNAQDRAVVEKAEHLLEQYGGKRASAR